MKLLNESSVQISLCKKSIGSSHPNKKWSLLSQVQIDGPSVYQVSLRLPQQSPIVELFAGERMLKIRRHKMRKHKRRKRYDRDYFKYQKYHRQKKAKAESLFRSRMSKMLEEYKAFDPEKYIKNIITCAKKDVTKDVSPSGRRKYPHWSTLVTLEELYGLPPTSYIDKKAGLAEAEERDKIRQLKKEYDQKYRGFLFRRNDSYSGPKQVSVLEERQEISNETVVQEKRRDDCSTDSEKTTVKADSPDDVIDSKSS
uniref:Uncharacterized protein n=1 Tax=Setaria digitata TaxID=48799 RepID=A0A915Q4Q7_9BILA